MSKAAPALATGAISALGSLGIHKIFGKGMHIPKKFFPMLPSIVNEFTQSQIDQINRVMQSGGRLVIKPTRKQLDGGFLGALASTGIPIAIELVSKMFGKGLQVDKTPPPPPNPVSNVYLPHSGGKFPLYPPPFYGNWNETIGMGKKKGKGKKTGRGKKKVRDCCWEKTVHSAAGFFCGSRVTGHGSRVTGHGSRVTGHGSRVTGHGSQVTGHGSQVTGHRSQVIFSSNISQE